MLKLFSVLIFLVTNIWICLSQDDIPDIELDAEEIFRSICGEGAKASLFRAPDSKDRIPNLYSIVILKCLSEEEVHELLDPLVDDDFQIEDIMCSDLLVQVELTITSDEGLAKVVGLEEVGFFQEVYNTSTTDHRWGHDRVNQRTLPLDYRYSATCDYPSFISGGWRFKSKGNRPCPQKPNIFIVDTGIAYNHVEFEGRAKYHYDYFGGGGWDYHGHGTHVAGIAGGKNYGVARNANLWSVRVLNAFGYGTSTSVQRGLLSILLRPKRPGVVNMSLRYFNNDFFGTFLINAIQIFRGIPVVVAAGNDQLPAHLVWPARVRSAITVGATDMSDNKAWFANFGNAVDIFAPGVDIYSAFPPNIYTYLSGTSMATPFVAGAAAIIKENLPHLRAREVAEILYASSSKNVVQNAMGSPNNLLYVCIPNEYIFYWIF